MGGGVIIDGRSRFAYDGSLAEFRDTLHKLGKSLDMSGLKIGTWPLPERGKTGIEIRFAGSAAEFGRAVDGLEKLRRSVRAIETVPLPEKPAPRRRRGPLQWRVATRRRRRRE